MSTLHDTLLFQSKTFGQTITVYTGYIEVNSLGLKNTIPISNIAEITQWPSVFRKMIRLSFNNGKKLDIYPKNSDEFLLIVSKLTNVNK